MIIEVRGTGTHNKGAELMLCAIRQRFLERNSNVQLVVESSFGPYPHRAQYGLWTKMPRRGRGRSWLISQLAPTPYCRNLGLVQEKDINAVLDASGLAFSDQWGPGPAETLFRESTNWRKRGIKSVLLPQAFGPFANPRVREAMRKALENVSLVYARDQVSYEHISELSRSPETVKLAPDFTNLLAAADTSDLPLPERFIAIVPNIRMVDRTEKSESEGYLGFLARSVRAAQDLGLAPVVVSHAPEADEKLANRLEQALGQNLLRIQEDSPLRIKGVLSRAEIVIGSRFHALVSALSSGVPCIGTSWNHKYAALFRDYQCEDFVLTSEASSEDIQQRLEASVMEPARTQFKNSLLHQSKKFQQLTLEMFAGVERCLGLA
jgi:polysaccharide pyruvyl transferase WcaK-like protein